MLAACAPDAAPLRTIERGTGNGPVIVLLHGYGSRPEHLVGLAERTDLPAGTRLVLPYAPEPTRSSDAVQGFVWWRFPCALGDLPRTSIPAMGAARDRVRALLDDIERRMGVRSDRIVLGGFSQGAMLALDVALHDPRPLAGIVLMSGTLVDEAAWRPRFASRRGLPAYVSHGREDDVLPFANAERLVERMREGGVDVRFRPFTGGHVATAETSTEIATFIREVTAR
ncbi:Phospholipase [Sandaracinus amylolyticus]|nr:Phospholipase [Sandaracinus amylolyticus]